MTACDLVYRDGKRVIWRRPAGAEVIYTYNNEQTADKYCQKLRSQVYGQLPDPQPTCHCHCQQDGAGYNHQGVF